jgi:predicted nucleic acid-binding protein
MEISVRPFQLEQAEVARSYEALLSNFPHLRIADIDRDVARKAASLRAKFAVRPADALQVAACLVHGAMAFVSNDRKLERLRSEIEILILDNWTSG